MEISDAIQLINSVAIPQEKPVVWADLGCGRGTFTLALAKLLPGGSTLYAIDKTRQNIAHENEKEVLIEFRQADFEKDDLSLPPLNGILMANALHYVKDKESLLKRLQKKLPPEGGFLIIEYDSMKANPWVPYPIDFLHLERLFYDLGFKQVTKLGERRSVYNRSNLYSCFAQKGK